MVIVFVSANDCHKLCIQPIYDLMKSQGYDCRWGSWHSPWGFVAGVNDGDVNSFVTGNAGIPTTELRNRTFFHPHGLHPTEQAYSSKLWKGQLAPGEWWFIHLREDEREEGHFPITGWAKLDKLFRPNIKEETIAKYGLDLPYEKTVLYAPTGNWHWATSFDKSVHTVLRLFENLPYNLIIKPAYISEGFKEWDSFLEYCKRAPKHIRKINEFDDITPVYSVSDVMITDGSSVAWEFISIDKPVIQLTNMEDVRSATCPGIKDCEICSVATSSGNLYKSYEECRLCGGTIKTRLEELESVVKRTVENPDEHVGIRREWAEKVNRYADGRCAERCVQAIKEIAEI